MLPPLTNTNCMEMLMSVLNIAKCSDIDLQLMHVNSLSIRHNDYHSVNDASDIVGLSAALLQPSGDQVSCNGEVCVCMYAYLCACLRSCEMTAWSCLREKSLCLSRRA
jgi:hypothetical protein